PCPLAKSWFTDPVATLSDCRIDGQAALLEEAITHAARLLAQSQHPLFFGLGENSTETIRKIADLADLTGGVLDATHPGFADPSGLILQTTGMISATLGEIRHRADVLLFLHADPTQTHPRHFERYSLETTGRFTPGGRADRHVMALGEAEAEWADQVNHLPPDATLDLLHGLWTLAQGKRLDEEAFQRKTGIEARRLIEIHERLHTAKYFAIVVGPAFFDPHTGQAALEMLAEYVRVLHEQTHGIISTLRPGPNWVGASAVVGWRSGYPGSSDFSQGFPRFDPEGFRATHLLEQNRVDLAFQLAGPWEVGLSEVAQQTLEKIPRIVLTHQPNAQPPAIGVRIPIARPGLNSGGTMYRMDDVPLPLRTLTEGKCPSAEWGVEEIRNAMKAS
ncbi:MAG: hypothetical protein WD045_15385, partial [Pirellulaceae bacterium]